VKALILGAGQGKRLLPLTAQEPKALLKLAGRSVLEWQVLALAAAGVDEVVFVSGFNSALVDQALREIAGRITSCRLRGLHNPFYGVADNIASCWLARGEMADDFILLNGDTIFQGALLKQLLASPPAPVTLAVDHKEHYDDDDMKVCLDGQRLLDVGKTLPLERVDGESIGCMVFRGEGPTLFKHRLEETLRHPQSLNRWYLSVIAELAREGQAAACSIEGQAWCEIDFPADLERAEDMVRAWMAG